MTEITSSTRIKVSSSYRTSFKITYIYGFSSGKFSYFLTRQRKDISRGSYFISKLVRVCQDDREYLSYTEVPLECRDSNGKMYHLVQAAVVGKAGMELSNRLGIGTIDDVLFATLSAVSYDEIPAQNSALCIYSIKNIQSNFTSNIHFITEDSTSFLLLTGALKL